METISLKVTLPKQGIERVFNFPSDWTVLRACRDIRTELLPEDDQTGQDHGLFWLPHGKWLDHHRTLGYFDFRQGDTVEYRKKHRSMAVKLMDESLQTIILDESLIASKISEEICTYLGLSNSNEYSLAVEVGEKSVGGGVLFRRSKDKLHTRWLRPYKTLPEQGILEHQVILLKKKFFFSDQSIDRDDLIQLSIVFSQSKLAVLSNEYLISTEEAIKFAALQCQAQFGDYMPDIHKPGVLSLEEFVAKDFTKKKDLEKRILHEYSKLKDLSTIDAQYRYVQLCRSLKLYGMTFFVVSEYDAKKNKTKRLLGVSRDGVTVMDLETRQVLNKWSLYNIRRWNSTPHTFTLDFGDYADKHYIVHTVEGDLIAQFISGYIDIIVQKRKQAEKFAEDDGFEDLDFAKEEILPVKASIISAASGSQNIYTVQPMSFSSKVLNEDTLASELDGFQRSILAVDDTNEVHKIFDNLIDKSIMSIRSSEIDIETILPVPARLDDIDMTHWNLLHVEFNKQNGSSQLARILIAVAGIISSILDDKIDYVPLTTHVISMLPDIIRVFDCCHSLASSQNEKGVNLDTFITISGAVSTTAVEFLRSLKDYSHRKTSSEDVVVFSRAFGSSCGKLLLEIDETALDRAAQRDLTDLSQNISTGLSCFMGAVKDVAATLESDFQKELLVMANHTATLGAQLVTFVSFTAIALGSDTCRDQLEHSIGQLESSVDALSLKANDTCTDQVALDSLNLARNQLKSQNEDLLSMSNRFSDPVSVFSMNIDEMCTKIVDAAQMILENIHVAPLVVTHAQILTNLTTQVVDNIKSRADREKDVEERHQLLLSARDLTDATTRVVDASKYAAKEPEDDQLLVTLQQAVSDLKVAAKLSTVINDRARVFRKLSLVARNLSMCAKQLVHTAKMASTYNRNPKSHTHLVVAAQNFSEINGLLLTAVRVHLKEPNSTLPQLNLVSASRSSIGPTLGLIMAARATFPSVGETQFKQQFSRNIESLHRALNDLKACVELAEPLSCTMLLDFAQDVCRRQLEEITVTTRKIEDGFVQFSLNNNSEELQLQIYATSKALVSSIDPIIEALRQLNENMISMAISDALTGVEVLARSSLLLCPFLSCKQIKIQFLDRLKEWLGGFYQLISLASEMIVQQDATEMTFTSLQTMAQIFNDNISKVLDFMPGQYEAIEVLQTIERLMEALGTNRIEGASFDTDRRDAYQRLEMTVTKYNQSLGGFLNASRGPTELLQESIRNFEAVLQDLTLAEISFLHSVVNMEQHSKVYQQAKELFNLSKRVMNGARLVAANLHDIQFQTMLVADVQLSTQTAILLLQAASSSASSIAECENAISLLEQSLTSLHECLNSSVEFEGDYSVALRSIYPLRGQAAQALSDSVIHAKNSSIETMAHTLHESFARYVVSIIQESVRPALLAIHVTSESRTSIGDASTNLILKGVKFARSCQSYSSNPQNLGALQVLSIESKMTSDCLNELVHVLRHNSPGVQSIEKALEKLRLLMSQMEFASVKMNLSDTHELLAISDFTEYRNRVVESTKALGASLSSAANASEKERNQLDERVSSFLDKLGVFEVTFIEALSKPPSRRLRERSFTQIICVLRLSQQVFEILKTSLIDCTGDEHETELEMALKSFHEAIQQLISFATLEDEFSGIFGAIASSMESLNETSIIESPDSNFHIDALSVSAGKLATFVSEALSLVTGSSVDVYLMSQKVGTGYVNLVEAIGSIMILVDSDEKRSSLAQGAQMVGHAITKLVESLRLIHHFPDDSTLRQNVSITGRDVSSKISILIQAVKEGSRGLYACEKVLGDIGLIISDLYTVSVLVSMGQLKGDYNELKCASEKDGLLKRIDSLEVLTKKLSDVCLLAQDDLAEIVGSIFAELLHMKESAKLAIGFLGESDLFMQEKLLSLAKMISTCFKTLIESVIGCYGRPSFDSLVKDHQTLVAIACDSLSEFSRLIKRLGNKRAKVWHAIECSMKSISVDTSTRFFEGPSDRVTFDPSTVILISKQVSVNVANLVASSSGTEEEIIDALAAFSNLISQLSTECRACVHDASPTYQDSMAKTINHVGSSSIKFLANIQDAYESTSPSSKLHIIESAGNVADACGQISTVINTLVPGGFVNVDTMFADRELLHAAGSIEIALNKLVKFNEALDESKFEASLVGAVRAIGAAVSALIVSATSAQQEISQTHHSVKSLDFHKTYFSDGTWSEGLVSAAKAVAVATSHLCEITNQAVQNQAIYERVAAAAKLVSSTTVHLLTAATVKLDVLSSSREKLNEAGRRVREGSEQLVKHALSAAALNLTGDLENLNFGQINSHSFKKLEIEAQTDVLRLEKELIMAREKLSRVRKTRYQNV